MSVEDEPRDGGRRHHFSSGKGTFGLEPDGAQEDADEEKQMQRGAARSEPAVSPDMLYKMSKKIAQLTKVIYSLNTRNEDLEAELENVVDNCEERLQLYQNQFRVANDNLDAAAANDGFGGEGQPPANGKRKTPEPPDGGETKRELRKARAALKHLENRVKMMERDSKVSNGSKIPTLEQRGLRPRLLDR